MGNSEYNNMEDLAFSRSFRNWVLNLDPADAAFWQNWVERHPEKAEMVRHAMALIFSLRPDGNLIREDQVGEEVGKALARLRDAARYLPAESGEVRRPALRSPMVLVTAILFMAMGAAAFLYFNARAHPNVLQSFLNAHRNEYPLREATGADEQTFSLPDGSLVRLGRNSKLYYPTSPRARAHTREVYLEGEAYFDIRKDPAVPFYVYTGELITRVLGTSLEIRANPDDPRSTVTVLSGKVSVYRADDFYDHRVGSAPGIIVTRNQEAVIDRHGDRLEKTVAPRPALPEGQPDSALVFRNTPVPQVFSRLEDLYGIPIQFDKTVTDSCMFTSRLDGRSFYQQLALVCQAIGGTFEVTDGSVVVTATGCR